MIPLSLAQSRSLFRSFSLDHTHMHKKAIDDYLTPIQTLLTQMRTQLIQSQEDEEEAKNKSEILAAASEGKKKNEASGAVLPQFSRRKSSIELINEY